MEKKDVLFAFKINISVFIQEFVLDTYKECKNHFELKVSAMMTLHKIQLPDEIDKNMFKTTADLWEH